MILGGLYHLGQYTAPQVFKIEQACVLYREGALPLVVGGGRGLPTDGFVDELQLQFAVSQPFGPTFCADRICRHGHSFGLDLEVRRTRHA